jgi:hypothetical protein
MPLMRSVFFIPAATERLMAKAGGIRADVVAFDLEDAVTPDAKGRAPVIAAIDRFAAVGWCWCRACSEAGGPRPQPSPASSAAP